MKKMIVMLLVAILALSTTAFAATYTHEDDIRFEYDDAEFEITMDTFLCRVTDPRFVRKEHVDHCWLAPKDMPKLDWAAADYPIVEKLVERDSATNCRISLL